MEYTLIKSNRRTMSLTVKGGKVVVRAPIGTSQESIEAFITNHRLWISRRLEEQKHAVKVDFSDGNTVELFGKRRIIATGRARIAAETIYLPTEHREEALIRLLRAYTRENMTAITEEIATKYGFKFQKITITSARGRWGSCNSKGNISYTFRAAFLPLELSYYLAAHELCHTRHMDHGRAFWAELTSIIPDCLERRRRLKGYLWAMQCL